MRNKTVFNDRAYADAVVELCSLLDAGVLPGDVEITVRNFFVMDPDKFWTGMIQPALADTAMDVIITHKPSQLFLDVLAAVRARDCEKLSAIDHDLRALVTEKREIRL